MIIRIFILLDVFCDEDGGKLFSNRTVCPACDTDLPGKYDIVRVDLQPSEEYKSVSNLMCRKASSISYLRNTYRKSVIW